MCVFREREKDGCGTVFLVVIVRVVGRWIGVEEALGLVDVEGFCEGLLKGHG